MGPWLTTIGLLLDIVGVMRLARGVILTKDKAKRLSATKWNGNTEVDKQLLQGARDGRIGVCILVVGFFLQILGTWVSNG